MRTLGFLAVLACCAAVIHAADEQYMLADFEKDADKAFEAPPGVTIVQEHAKSGTHALKVVQEGDAYPGIGFDKPDQLKRFAEFPIFKMDIFNPQDTPAVFTVSAGDGKSTNYGTRFNNDGMVARPGWSTLLLNLTGLTRSNSNNFLERGALNMKDLKFLKVFLCPQGKGKTTTLYFDDARLVTDGLPKVEGLRAFDFGPSTSAVFAGFEGVNEKSQYNPQRGFGWQSPQRHRRPGNPDDLDGDYGCGDAFIVDLKPGAYVVNLCVDTFGEWQGTQFFKHRTITINGKTVLTEDLDGETFMKTRYLRYEEDEDAPGMDIWEARVKPFLPLRSYETEVGADGKLTAIVQTTGGWPGLITSLIVYPKAKETEGKAFLTALDKIRKDAFNNGTPLNLPKPDRAAPKPTAAETALGFIPFARTADADINCTSAPDEKERGAPLGVTACPGERTATQLGLLPLKAISGVKVSVSDLAGPGGASIPASAVTLRRVRNFAKNHNGATLLPFILQPFDTVTLTPGLTRSIWVTAQVPDNAAAGKYTGTVKVNAADKVHTVPFEITVLPFTLDKADDITISCTGTTAGHWRGYYPELEPRWWQVAEEVMRDQAEHGMNAVTGGPGMQLKSLKDGKAEIDFTDADRWLALAVKYGLTKTGDAYQGLDVVGFARTQNKDCMTSNEANAQKSFGIGFGELIKIVYGAVEAHAKEKNWPQRVYYLLDEPRPEFGNVESARQLIELHVKSAPETKFSGYYSPGGGRDPYFKLMPVSIAHHTAESIKTCRDNGKEAWTYTGGGARYDIGRWLFFAKANGLTGFLRNGYQYVNSSAYYDFSDTEGSWAQVYPSQKGIAATVGWERTALGVNDYRYLKTLQARIAAAKKEAKNQAAADAAEAFLTQTLKPINLDHAESAALSPDEWAAFRAELAKNITALSK